MKKTRIFSIFLAFALCVVLFTLTPPHASAETLDNGTFGDNLTWTLDDVGTLTISGIGDMPTFNSTNPAPWKAIRSAIKTIVIGNDITSVSKSAFTGCENLTKVIMSDSLISIGESAFASCQKLTDVTLSQNLTHIGAKAFQLCRELSNIDLPNSLTTIGSNAFVQCSKLSEVNIGSKVKSIGSGAFQSCAGLKTIVISDNVTDLGSHAFAYCTSLTSVTLGSGISKIYGGTFSYCSSLTSITIPGNVSTIEESAFSNCTSLTSVTINNGTTSIGMYAFYQCNKLNRISFPDGITQIANSAFSGCDALTTLVFGQGLQTIGESAFAGCDNLQAVSFPDSLTSIGRKAFDNCPNYRLVVLPASIQEVGYYAFYNVWHVWFKGTESQWNSIPFDPSDSLALNRKTVHFSCSGNECKTEVIAATCTVNGYTQFTCSVCKEIRQVDPVRAPGHSYGAWYVAKEATHASKGMERRDCKNCNHYESKDIPIQSHTDQNNDTICDGCGSFFCATHTEQTITGTAATCTQDGLTDGKKCSVCDALLQAQEVIPASGHHYGDWTTTTEGSKERICELCGEKEQQAETSTPTTTPSWETIGTLPTTQSGAASSDEEVKKNPVVIVLIFLAVGAVSGGAAAVLIKKKRK